MIELMRVCLCLLISGLYVFFEYSIVGIVRFFEWLYGKMDCLHYDVELDGDCPAL